MRKRLVRFIVVVLCVATVLCGCAPDLESIEAMSTESTALDDFLLPTTQNTEPVETTGHAKSGSLTLGPLEIELDSKGSYLQYNGGEMIMPISIIAEGLMAEHDMGVLLFVDGQLQSYKTADDDTYRYMHVFSSEDRVRMVPDLYFRHCPVKKMTL